MTLNVSNVIAIHLLSVLILLVIAENVSNFKRSNVPQICVEEGRFGAYDCINLAKGVHGTKVGEVDVGRHQVNVPKDEVSMEVDDCFHAYVRKVGQIEHEARHHVKHQRQFVLSIARKQVDVNGCKSTH